MSKKVKDALLLVVWINLTACFFRSFFFNAQLASLALFLYVFRVVVSWGHISRKHVLWLLFMTWSHVLQPACAWRKEVFHFSFWNYAWVSTTGGRYAVNVGLLWEWWLGTRILWRWVFCRNPSLSDLNALKISKSKSNPQSKQTVLWKEQLFREFLSRET